MATIARRLGPADHGRAMSLDEFLGADEEPGYRYELARGVLEVTEVPNDAHGTVVWNLLRAMAAYEQAHPGVIRRAGGGGEFRLWLPGMISGRNPDLAVVLRGALVDPRGRRRPSLAAEVISEDSRDRDDRVKREEYLAYGLYEYWIVDPFARRVTALYRDGAAWVERRFEGEQRVESLVLAGLDLRVADLWMDADAEPGGAAGQG